jgi:hypothetical protein
MTQNSEHTQDFWVGMTAHLFETDGYLPVFMDMTDGKTQDLERARPLDISSGFFLDKPALLF